VIRISQPMTGPEEEQAVLEALRSGQLAQGPRVAEFEEAFAGYTGAKHAVAVSSGTAALVIALRAHGIGAGDEVIVPAFTFAATANAVLLAGAQPVLVDVRDDDLTIDAECVEAAVTERTRAFIPVHLYGQMCDMTALGEIALRRALLVIEDACQATGASWGGQKAGTFGTGCFSFYATKNMTTGEGGMITTDDDAMARRARLLRNQGEDTRYKTDLLGENARMTEIEAALGLAQLAKLDAWNERRRENASWLSERLQGVETPVERAGSMHVYHQYTVRVRSGDRLKPIPLTRDALAGALHEREIETAVYYPRCVHQQPLYQELGIGGSFPVAERAAETVLSLPVHPALSPDDLEEIATAVNESMAAVGARRG
jgi:dTDP-4-amino-4,6-dideoxygalactose transaminase